MPRDSGDDAYAEMAEIRMRVEKERAPSSDPELEGRLFQAREEALFHKHLRQVFGDRHVEFSADLRVMLRELWTLGRVTKESGLVAGDMHKIYTTPRKRLTRKQTYPATVGVMSPEWPAASKRDTTRPACPSCGGRGVGDYPHACNTCGGTGNG